MLITQQLRALQRFVAMFVELRHSPVAIMLFCVNVYISQVETFQNLVPL